MSEHDNTTDRGVSDSNGQSRRSFLKKAGVVGGTVATSGCIGIIGPGGGGRPPIPTGNETAKGVDFPAALNPKRYAKAFDRVVNIVEAGADPTGKQDVAPVIDSELKDNTLLVFPKGRYKLNSQIARRGNKNMGLVGQNAVLTHGTVEAIDGFDVTTGEYSGKAQHFKIGTPERPHQGKFVFGGFTADWRGKSTGMQIVQVNTAGVAEISNVRQIGVHDLGCQGPFRFNPTTKNARILTRNLDIRPGGLTYQKTINTRNERSGGGEHGRSWATTGLAMHPEADGYLRVQNVYCGAWPDNGIYVLGGKPNEDPATVEVVGCVSANSHPSNIRIGGKNSKILNCMVVVDESFDEDYYFNQRPIRLDQGSCSVKNTRIIQKVPTGWGITVQTKINRATLRNIEISIYNKRQTALVVDERASNVTVDGLQINTVGWRGIRPMLIRGSPDILKNVSISSQTG